MHRQSRTSEAIFLPEISRLKGLEVLVVEDDNDTRELLGLLLESRGATAILAHNVAEGLEALRKQRPDVIVADIGMPEYNGYAFIAAVRKEPQSEAHPSLR